MNKNEEMYVVVIKYSDDRKTVLEYSTKEQANEAAHILLSDYKEQGYQIVNLKKEDCSFNDVGFEESFSLYLRDKSSNIKKDNELSIHVLRKTVVYIVNVIYQYDGYDSTEVFSTRVGAIKYGNTLVNKFKEDEYGYSEYNDKTSFNEKEVYKYACITLVNKNGEVRVSIERKILN